MGFSRVLRTYLSYILSASMVLTPYVTWATPSTHSDSINQNEEKKIKKSESIIQNIHKALMDGKLKEYLNSNPDLKKEFDTLLISNQVATFLNPLGDITKTIHYDTENHISKFSDKILEIKVDYDENESLIFKGVVIRSGDKIEEHVSVVQKINNISKNNVIDYSYDGEILAILYNAKDGVKIILYDMSYAKELIGGSPIPSNSFYVGTRKEFPDVKLEFIQTKDINPNTIDLEKYPIRNSSGNFLLKAGDLLFYSEKRDGSKTFLTLKSREELYEHLKEMYESTDLLLEVRHASSNLSEILDLDTEKKNIETHESQRIVYDLISGIFNGNALDFLNQYRKQFSNLAINYFPYKKDQTRRNKMMKIEIGVTPMEIVKGEEQLTRIQKITNFLKGDGLELGGQGSIALIAGGLAFFYFSSFIATDRTPTMNVSHNMVLLGLGVLAMVYTLPSVFMKSLKWTNKLMNTQKKPPKALKQSQQSIQKTIQKWEGSDTKTLLTGLGFKIVSILAPVFKRLFQIGALSPVHYGLTNGLGRESLSPIKKDSALGKELRLKKDHKPFIPSWIPSKNNEKTKVFDSLIQRKKRIDHLARVMTYYAMNETPSFTPTMSWMGTFDIELPKLIEKRGGEDKFLSDFHWIQEKLGQYIMASKKDTIKDILLWDSASLDSLYEKAIELNEKSKNITTTQKRLSRFADQSKFLLADILDFNTAQADRLHNIKPNATIAQQFSVGLIMDHVLMITFPLTPLTPRGSNDYGLGVDDFRGFNSSSPHLVEVALNVLAHIRGSAVNQIVDMSGQELEKLYSLMKISETDYKFSNNQKDTEVTALNYLFSSLKFPFQMGAKINQGSAMEERVDIGHFGWNMIKNWYRFMFIGLTITFVTRELFTAYGMDMSLLGTLYFAAGGIIYFGWPQFWTFTHNQSIAKRVQNNKESIQTISSVIRRISENLYPKSHKSEFENKDFKDSFTTFRSLYQHFKQFYAASLDKKHKQNIFQSFNHFKNFELLENYIETSSEKTSEELLKKLEDLSLEEKIELVNLMGQTIQKNQKYFPTENSTLGLNIHMLITLGIVSNLAFVYLSVDSFDHAQVTWTNIATLAALTFGGFFSYYKLGALSLTDHANQMKGFLSKNKVLNNIQKRKPTENFLFGKEKTSEQQNIINALQQEGITHISQLKKLSNEELLQISGIGEKRVEVIQEALQTTRPGLIRRATNKCMNVFNKIGETS